MQLNNYLVFFKERLSGRTYETLICATSKPHARQLLLRDWPGKKIMVRQINKLPLRAGVLWLGPG